MWLQEINAASARNRLRILPPGRLGGQAVMEIAGRIGLDARRLRQDMDDPEIAACLAETQRLADAFGVTGTPSFAIGDELVLGAVGGAGMNR